ncbi:MAG: hypothetical protein IJX28_01445 [Clostridia bacterium]|nr:hypothetical protein [Clostridia bacterium]
MKDLHSYVPEAEQLEHKQRPTSRELWEDLAVLDAGNAYRILAARGEDFTVGEDFFLRCPIPTEHRPLLAALSPRSPRLLLPTRDGRTLLLFAEGAALTGLVLAVRLPLPPTATLRALHFLNSDDLLFPAALSPKKDPSPRVEDEEVCRRLSEVLYYLNRILAPGSRVGLWTRCLLIANFTGCPLDRASLPTQVPPLGDYDEARLRFFLLCAFLSLRGSAGSIGARGDALPLSPATPLYRCRVTLSPTEPLADATPPIAAPIPFLTAPCFADLLTVTDEKGLRMEVALPVSHNREGLRASGPAYGVRLCIFIEKT